MSTYPGTLDTLETDKTNFTPQLNDHPDHHNELADAVNKIEAELGTNPSAGFSTVAARIAADETGLANHLADTSDAHDASAISIVDSGAYFAATDVEAALQEIGAGGGGGGGGAPTTADYLVGTTQGGLSAEIVVGTTPGGELGGTWASPTVDTTHSGSSHASVQAAAEATAAAALNAHVTDATDAHDASAISVLDVAGDFTATDVEGALAELQSRAETDTLDLANHLADTTDAHDASAISFVPTGSLSSTDVQAAIAEVLAEAGGGVSILDDGVLIGSRPALNFHEGSGITLTIADDAGADEVDITVAATAATAGSLALFNYLIAR